MCRINSNTLTCTLVLCCGHTGLKAPGGVVNLQHLRKAPYTKTSDTVVYFSVLLLNMIPMIYIKSSHKSGLEGLNALKLEKKHVKWRNTKETEKTLKNKKTQAHLSTSFPSKTSFVAALFVSVFTACLIGLRMCRQTGEYTSQSSNVLSICAFFPPIRRTPASEHIKICLQVLVSRRTTVFTQFIV